MARVGTQRRLGNAAPAKKRVATCMAWPLPVQLPYTVSPRAGDLRKVLLLFLYFSVALVTVEGQYTVITAADSFPPADYLHVVAPEGLSRTVTTHVYLTGGETFLLVDKTGEVMHAPTRFRTEAYRYDGKRCDVDNTVPLSVLFPLAPTTHTYWTQPIGSPSRHSSFGQEHGPVFWKFNNPPADFLNKRDTRFCYRLVKAPGTYTVIRSTSAPAAGQVRAPKTTADDIADRGGSENPPGDRNTAETVTKLHSSSSTSTENPVAVFIFHSEAHGLIPATACAVSLLLSVPAILWQTV